MRKSASPLKALPPSPACGRGLWWGLLLLVVILLVTPALAVAVPTYDKVKEDYASTEGVLLDRNGVPIQELRVDLHGRRLSWVQLADVSPALLEAVIRAED